MDQRRVASDLMHHAVEAEGRRDFALAAKLAADAAAVDSSDAQAWRLAGVFHEKVGDYGRALDAYEQALGLSPGDAGLARDIARLAHLLKLPEMAERFLLRALAQDRDSLEIANDLALTYCAQSRFSDAIALLQATVTAHQHSAMLWNTLGCVLFEAGQAEQSLVFFDEAIRLQGDMHAAYFNRANARRATSDLAGALKDCEHAIGLGADSPGQAAMYRYAKATILLADGQVEAGWRAYGVRNEKAYADYVQPVFDAAELRIDTPLAGRRVLVIGEQGLGDEVLFANALGDAAAEIGDGGRLIIAVEPRLTHLFQRSFPAAQVVAYRTSRTGMATMRDAPDLATGAYDGWTRIGDLSRRYRGAVAAFPSTAGFLKPDGGRIDHWRARLSALGPCPKVGVIWRSLLMTSERQKFYPPLDLWRPVFTTPDVSFINLQAGDCADEISAISTVFGAKLHDLGDIDLGADLDELAALSCALDLTLGPATATTNIAAATGAPTWIITTPDAWTRLGTSSLPWYPQARAFSGARTYDWPTVMNDVGAALGTQFAIRS